MSDMLQPVALPYLQRLQNAVFHQDNARPHTAIISRQALQGTPMLPSQPLSPELSPIEHLWDVIGRRLRDLPQPQSDDDLWRMVESIWLSIPQVTIRTLMSSVPRRVAACIAARGGPTVYWSRCVFHRCTALPFLKLKSLLCICISVCLPIFITFSSLFHGVAFSLSGSVYLKFFIF
ncbi:hypothetical protein JGC18_24850 [Salmonella enterica subsp. enterica serovar Typhimurium]|nr:hypothetical protein [Salmonella enterica subsp. enterica serovar Typhimurium]